MKLKDLLLKSQDRDYLENLTALQLNFDESVDQIDNDYLINLASIISTCINLVDLNLQYGFIGIRNSINYSVLFEVLSKLDKLTKLNLDFNYIGYLGNDDIQAFADFIAGANLTYLSLIDNNLGLLNHYNLEKIFIAIPKCKTLEHLYILADNDLHCKEDHTFNMIYQSFMNCPNLMNLEKFTPYLSKEREEQVSIIRSMIVSRVNFHNNSIFTKYFSNVFNSAQNNMIDNNHRRSSVQSNSAISSTSAQDIEEQSLNKNFFGKLQSLNCKIM